MNPTARDLLEQALKARGYDGLVSPDGECSCLIGELAFCEADPLQCIAGYKVDYAEGECPCGMGCKFHVVAGKRVKAQESARVDPITNVALLPCPKCGSARVGVVVYECFWSKVKCYGCSQVGPTGKSYVETVRLWNEAAEPRKGE